MAKSNDELFNVSMVKYKMDNIEGYFQAFSENLTWVVCWKAIRLYLLMTQLNDNSHLVHGSWAKFTTLVLLKEIRESISESDGPEIV